MSNQDYKQELIRRSYNFSLEIVRLIRILPRNDLATEVMSRQILRSATSIGANIVEAQAASSKRDFVNFLSYSLKSANETKYWLGLLRDSDTISKDEAKDFLQKVTEIANMLGSSIVSLRSSQVK